MWGAASMTLFEAHSDIHPSEKSVHLLVVSPEKLALSRNSDRLHRHTFLCDAA